MRIFSWFHLYSEYWRELLKVNVGICNSTFQRIKVDHLQIASSEEFCYL